ncbi:hypothetical protein VNO78_35025 [Psophocarpus tetragonolobus]|uniref:Uncharacterized protein n=1 Tax=Psophocarpus tetragonolobus TaxID=3891 RepID=A0AAN9NND1_PSOTE
MHMKATTALDVPIHLNSEMLDFDLCYLMRESQIGWIIDCPSTSTVTGCGLTLSLTALLEGPDAATILLLV